LNHKKTHKEWPLPRGFFSAINDSAKLNPSWSNLQYNKLFPKKGVSTFPDFEEAYVWEVWGNFTQIEHLTDAGVFMRHFINSIPEESFNRLRNSETKAKDLHQTFFAFFDKGTGVTFPTLKEWAVKLKPLSD
jgi:hypothetical protein